MDTTIGLIKGKLQRHAKDCRIFIIILLSTILCNSCNDYASETIYDACLTDFSKIKNGSIIHIDGKMIRSSLGYGFLITNDICSNEKGISVLNVPPNIVKLFNDSMNFDYRKNEVFAISGRFVVEVSGISGKDRLGRLVRIESYSPDRLEFPAKINH